MPSPVPETELKQWGDRLIDPSAPLVERSRALWGLRHAVEPLALEILAKFVCDFVHPSPVADDLLQHEAAYCLGQGGGASAVPHLIKAIRNEQHVTLIRHEAGEALAALANRKGVDLDEIEQVLKEFSNSSIVELAETCQIGLHRVNCVRKYKETGVGRVESDLATEYYPDTIDPMSSFGEDSSYEDVYLKNLLISPSESLVTRYQAMFTLRDRILSAIKQNKPSETLVALLAEGLSSPGSALCRHEVAFCLGQLAHPAAVVGLINTMKSKTEHPMVRHEAAEALGSVLGQLEAKFLSQNVRKASVDEDLQKMARDALKEFVEDPVAVVRESCVLALDIADHIASPDRFQYANVPEN